jgi:hypothetical protein
MISLIAQWLIFVGLVFIAGVAVGVWWANRAIMRELDKGPVFSPSSGYLLTPRGKPGDIVEVMKPEEYRRDSATPVKDWMSEVSPEEEYHPGLSGKDTGGGR